MAYTWRSDAAIDRILDLREREHLSWKALAEITDEPVWRLRYWARRRTTPPNSERPSFIELVPMSITPSTATRDEASTSTSGCADSSRFEVDLPSGFRVHVAADFDVEALRRLVTVLSSC